MVQYRIFDGRNPIIIKYDIDEQGKITHVERFKDGEFKRDYEMTQIVERGVKFGILDSTSRILEGEELNKLIEKGIYESLSIDDEQPKR